VPLKKGTPEQANEPPDRVRKLWIYNVKEYKRRRGMNQEQGNREGNGEARGRSSRPPESTAAAEQLRQETVRAIVPTQPPPTVQDDQATAPESKVTTLRTVSGAVCIGKFGEPVLIDGKPKTLLSFVQFKVVKALVDAGARGLAKDDLEHVSSGARRCLKLLRRDPDWSRVIHMAGGKGARYRID
jgi:hypothetical protein